MTSLKEIIADIKKNHNARSETVSSITKINQYMYMMDYTVDYGLDELLERGVSNIGELIAYATKTVAFGSKKLKMKQGGGACTTFNAKTPDGDYIFARNYDYKASPCLIIWTHPENGYASVGITEFNFMLWGNKTDPTVSSSKIRSLLAPYCTLDGINEKGLAIGVVEIKAKSTYQETGKIPFTTTAMIRAVLDKCATVEEAVELFKKYDMHDSLFCCYHYQIADASGKSVIIEYANNEMIVYEPKPVEGGEHPVQHLENFFLTEGCDNSKAMGYDRSEKVDAKLNETKGIMDECTALDLLHDCVLYYRHKLGWQVITLWSAIYNLDKKEVKLCAAMDYNRCYRISLDKPLKYTKE